MYPVHKLMIANRCSKYILLAWCLHYILTYALYDPRLRKQKKLLVCALWDAFIKSGQPMIFALWLFILVLPWSAVVGSYQIYCKIIRPALLKK